MVVFTSLEYGDEVGRIKDPVAVGITDWPLLVPDSTIGNVDVAILVEIAKERIGQRVDSVGNANRYRRGEYSSLIGEPSRPINDNIQISI